MTPGTPDIAELKRQTADLQRYAEISNIIYNLSQSESEPISKHLSTEDARVMDRVRARLSEKFASSEENARLRAENERLVEESARLRVGLNSAVGYMMNAQIDLRTGAPKQTAINTVNGGIDVLRAALGAPK